MLAFFTSRRGFSEVGEVASRNERVALAVASDAPFFENE